MVTVECPLCGKPVEVPEFNKTTRSDALLTHIASEHIGAIRPTTPSEGPPLPRGWGVRWPWKK